MRPSLPLVCVLLLSGCARQPLPDLSKLPAAPRQFPESEYRAIAAQGNTIYQPDQGRSELRVHVGKAGSMARLGHRHLLSTSSISGYAAPTDNGWRADLFFSPASLIVDDPGLRALAGDDYAKEIPEEDREGTRANLLGEDVLHVTRYPFVKASIRGFELDAQNPQPVTFFIRDHTATVSIKPDTSDDPLRLQGEVIVSHEVIGLTPFSILGGAVAVADEVRIEFSLVFEEVR